MNIQDDRYDDPAPRKNRVHMPGQLFAGILIVVVGILFLLDNLGWIESRDVFRLWPTLLILAGVKNILVARDRGTAVTGVLMASLGSFWLLKSLGIINFSIGQLWPLVLVVFGLQMLMRSFGGPPAPENLTDTAPSFSNFAFLGGIARKNSSQDFRSGAATAFMGGVELDLHKAEMEGSSAAIQIFAMMGGVSIRIPESWSVDSRVVAILGGVDDKTTSPADGSKRLILQGSVFMGGLELKN